jgi:hypothetical protein
MTAEAVVFVTLIKHTATKMCFVIIVSFMLLTKIFFGVAGRESTVEKAVNYNGQCFNCGLRN